MRHQLLFLKLSPATFSTRTTCTTISVSRSSYIRSSYGTGDTGECVSRVLHEVEKTYSHAKQLSEYAAAHLYWGNYQVAIIAGVDLHRWPVLKLEGYQASPNTEDLPAQDDGDAIEVTQSNADIGGHHKRAVSSISVNEHAK